MTFSLAAKCERTGAFGVVAPSSSACVTGRCAEVRAGAGAVACQNITDPALGDLGLELLGRGYSANRVLTVLVEAGDYPEHRPIAVVDGSGHIAHRSGSNTLGHNAVASGRLCIAAGNLLKHKEVPAAMVATLEADPDAELAERLPPALETGEKSAGEEGAVRSAGLEAGRSRLPNGGLVPRLAPYPQSRAAADLVGLRSAKAGLRHPGAGSHRSAFPQRPWRSATREHIR